MDNHQPLLKTFLLSAVLLLIYFALDAMLFARKAGPFPRVHAQAALKNWDLRGKVNLLLLAGIVLAVLLSGLFRLGTAAVVYGVPLEGQNIARDLALLALAVSLRLTSPASREANGFSWTPIEEVAKLFWASLSA